MNIMNYVSSSTSTVVNASRKSTVAHGKNPERLLETLLQNLGLTGKVYQNPFDDVLLGWEDQSGGVAHNGRG
jgi:hypothetical protein